MNQFCAQRLDVSSWDRIQFPGPLGGCSVHLPSADAEAAFVATWLNTCDILLCQQLGRPVSRKFAESQFADAVSSLQTKGVLVNASGTVSFTPQALRKHTSGPWALETLPDQLFSAIQRSTSSQLGTGSRVHGRIMRGLDSLSATCLYLSLDDHLRTIMLSSGGPGTGKLFAMFPPAPKFYMDNVQFKAAVNKKLGLMIPPPGATVKFQHLMLISSLTNAAARC